MPADDQQRPNDQLRGQLFLQHDGGHHADDDDTQALKRVKMTEIEALQQTER